MSEHEVDLIVARLRDELTARPDAAAKGRSDDSFFSVGRTQAERFWAVTADRPFLYKPGWWGRVRGTLLVPPKVVLRKLMRWYLEPALSQQRDFNSSILKALDELRHHLNARLDHLSERVDSAHSKLERAEAHAMKTDSSLETLERQTDSSLETLERQATEADERLVRLERRARRGDASPPPAVAARSAPHISTGAEVVPDYFAFEARMRGSRELIRERQAPYVEDFRNAAPVLDVGCGRGEFLELLRDSGIEGRGIDLDADMVEHCREEGLDVARVDAVDYLKRLEEGSLGGIFCAHVVEHLAPSALFRLLELAATKLRPAGILIAETPNPKALIALSMFFADLTHLRPLDPETFAFLARQAGFRQVETRFLNEPPAKERLQQVWLPDDQEHASARPALARNIDRINEVVFGPQDFALVAHA